MSEQTTTLTKENNENLDARDRKMLEAIKKSREEDAEARALEISKVFGATKTITIEDFQTPDSTVVEGFPTPNHNPSPSVLEQAKEDMA